MRGLARLPAVAVGRAVVVVAGARLDVGPAAVALPPVRLLGGRVDRLGDRLARVAAADRAGDDARHRPDGGPDRAGDAAGHRPRHRPGGGPAGRGPDADADRVRPGLAAERVAVL